MLSASSLNLWLSSYSAKLLQQIAFVLSVYVGTCWTIAPHSLASAPEQPRFEIDSSVTAILQESCLDCHTGKDAEAGVALDNLGSIDLEQRLDLLNRVQSQVIFNLMPPDDSNSLTALQQKQLAEWVSKELGKHSASQLEQKLKEPAYGNLVPHDQLFSNTENSKVERDLPAKAFTPARRWLVSPQIFMQRVNEIEEHTSVLRFLCNA